MSDSASQHASFRVCRSAEVRQAPSRTSALFHTVQPGKVVKQMGRQIKLPDGSFRVPLLPRGWIDADVLEGLPTTSSSTAEGIGSQGSAPSTGPATVAQTPEPEQMMLEKQIEDASASQEAMAFRVRYEADVRQAASPESPPFRRLMAGTIVKQMGDVLRLPSGALRVPLQPRGWIDAAALTPAGSTRNPPGLGSDDVEPNAAELLQPSSQGPTDVKRDNEPREAQEWLGALDDDERNEKTELPISKSQKGAPGATSCGEGAYKCREPPQKSSDDLKAVQEQPTDMVTTQPGDQYPLKSGFVRLQHGLTAPEHKKDEGIHTATSIADQPDSMMAAVPSSSSAATPSSTVRKTADAEVTKENGTIKGGTSRQQVAARLKKSIEEHLKSGGEVTKQVDVVQSLLAKLGQVLKRMALPGEAKIFGSYATGFKSGSSDIDIAYVGDIENGQVMHMLAVFATLLPEFGFENVTKVLQASTPLVRFTDSDSGVEVDFCMSNALGIRNSLLLDSYCRCDHRVAQLGRLVKDWAKRHEIVGTADGFLNSYAYMLLVIYYLQVLQPPVLPNLQSLADQSVPCMDSKWGVDDRWETKFYDKVETLPPSENTKNIVELLTGFFKFYSLGQSFNWSSHAVCVRLSGAGVAVDKFSLATTTYPEQWYVEDPFDLKHNLGGRCSLTGRERTLAEMRRALSALSAGNLNDVCMAEPHASYFLRCRISHGLTPPALLEEFKDCSVAKVHFPKPVGGRLGQAFLEFASSSDRRRGHAKNESYVGDCQLQLMASSRYGLAEAADEFSYEVHEPILLAAQNLQ
eukprot:TRINITY_DN59125_c0_g1_i1.p1 TRINITY_DN59125_c0_g1~~TRINITY_DN59125_c0_g1_i1.p1  ORF type:complete len:804 (+),score=130.21 TRINITY_DN59125_c0_g1_i1:37-2448(+)